MVPVHHAGTLISAGSILCLLRGISSSPESLLSGRGGGGVRTSTRVCIVAEGAMFVKVIVVASLVVPTTFAISGPRSIEVEVALSIVCRDYESSVTRVAIANRIWRMATAMSKEF